MATTPTSYFNRLTGQEPCTDGLQVYGASAQFVTVAAATTTLAIVRATHAGKIILVQSTGGLAVTPAPATGTGDIYTFVVITTVSGGNFTIDPKLGNASDVCAGSLYGGTTGATGSVWVTASNSNLITFNGSTTGGLAGTCVFMMDMATNKWQVWGTMISSGSSATPFSNH